MDALIAQFFRSQDQLITRRQALTGMTQAAINHRLGRYWQVVLPGIYAAFTGPLTARHRARAALLYAGEGSILNDLAALRHHRIAYLPDDVFTRVLVSTEVQRSSRDFVVVRRTEYLPIPMTIDDLRVAPLPRALREFCARHPDERAALAVAADAVQRGRVTMAQILAEIECSPHRGRRRLLRIANQLGAGVRSAPEADFRALVMSSRVLPEPLWNPLIQLPSGQILSPDALFVDSGVVHETNGRRFHAGEDSFEDMQRRNDVMVSAGLAVLHNSPRRLRREGPMVLREVETVCTARAGLGLPAGIVILREAA